jgi:hypothetical protein
MVTEVSRRERGGLYPGVERRGSERVINLMAGFMNPSV